MIELHLHIGTLHFILINLIYWFVEVGKTLNLKASIESVFTDKFSNRILLCGLLIIVFKSLGLDSVFGASIGVLAFFLINLAWFVFVFVRVKSREYRWLFTFLNIAVVMLLYGQFVPKSWLS